MFSKQFRLPAKTNLRHGFFINTLVFSVRIAPNQLDYNRYGFVTSKKIDTRATQRNFLKRRFRAIIEELHPNLATGSDFLFVLKKQARQIDADMLKQEVLKNLSNYMVKN